MPDFLHGSLIVHYVLVRSCEFSMVFPLPSHTHTQTSGKKDGSSQNTSQTMANLSIQLVNSMEMLRKIKVSEECKL